MSEETANANDARLVVVDACRATRRWEMLVSYLGAPTTPSVHEVLRTIEKRLGGAAVAGTAYVYNAAELDARCGVTSRHATDLARLVRYPVATFTEVAKACAGVRPFAPESAPYRVETNPEERACVHAVTASFEHQHGNSCDVWEPYADGSERGGDVMLSRNEIERLLQPPAGGEPPCRFVLLVHARNAAAWIRTTLASAHLQTHAAWRGVIVDDASHDGTLRTTLATLAALAGDPSGADAALEVSDRTVQMAFGRWRIVRRTIPVGFVPCLKHAAVDMAANEYALFLSAGDAFVDPGSLAALSDALLQRKRPGVAFARALALQGGRLSAAARRPGAVGYDALVADEGYATAVRTRAGAEAAALAVAFPDSVVRDGAYFLAELQMADIAAWHHVLVRGDLLCRAKESTAASAVDGRRIVLPDDGTLALALMCLHVGAHTGMLLAPAAQADPVWRLQCGNLCGTFLAINADQRARTEHEEASAPLSASRTPLALISRPERVGHLLRTWLAWWSHVTHTESHAGHSVGQQRAREGDASPYTPSVAGPHGTATTSDEPFFAPFLNHLSTREDPAGHADAQALFWSLFAAHCGSPL